jgi:hypothetical protein
MKKNYLFNLLLILLLVVKGYSIYPKVDWTKARTTIGTIGNTINVSTKEGLTNALSTRNKSILTK